MRCSVYVFSLFLTFCVPTTVYANCSQSVRHDWTSSAIRLTGESEKSRENAIKKLKVFPHLLKVLRSELRCENRFLALDVVSALALTQLIPDLTELSKDDEDGFVYLALNSLINPRTRSIIGKVYMNRLEQRRDSLSPAAKVSMIDGLWLMKVALLPGALQAVIQNEPYEVKSAAIHYLREFMKGPGSPYFPIVKSALSSKPYQLRLEALDLLDNLSPSYRLSSLQVLPLCRNDPNLSVKQKCHQMMSKLRHSG